MISFFTLALSDCASYLIACRKYSTACSYSLKNVLSDQVHGGLGLPQGLFIILVLVLLRCLGDQVYGLLKRVARHGRHSGNQTATSLKSYLRLQTRNRAPLAMSPQKRVVGHIFLGKVEGQGSGPMHEIDIHCKVFPCIGPSKALNHSLVPSLFASCLTHFINSWNWEAHWFFCTSPRASPTHLP